MNKTLIAAGILSFCGAVQAQEVLTYTGLFSGTITLTDSLTSNMVNQVVSPVSFNIQSPYWTMDQTGGGFPVTPHFSFSTSSSGTITGWDIDGSTVYGAGASSSNYYQAFQSTMVNGTGTESFEASYGSPLCAHPDSYTPSLCNVHGDSRAITGTWSSAPAQAPEIDPGSVGTSLTLLVGLLLVFKGQRE